MEKIIGSYFFYICFVIFLLLLLAQYTKENGLSLGKIFDSFRINAEDYSNIVEKIAKTSLGDVLDGDKLSVEKLSKAIGSSNSIILDYVQTLKDTNGNIDLTTASTEGLSEYLNKSGNSFQFAAIKATLLNTALNAGIFFVASVAIQGIVKALDNYIHRVEKARERTSELFDEFKSMNDTLTDHKKTVSELADRYDELSKGVNLSTNANISLSTEEYEEFLDINEKLANSFPELAKGIDENGNSILTFGTKGITAKEQLKELLQTEEDLNNFRIAEGLDEAFKGVYTYIEDANEATEKLNGSINDSSEAMVKLQDVAENGIKLSGDGQLIFSGNISNQAELDYMNALTKSVNEFWKSLDGERRVELGVSSSELLTQNFDEYTGAFEAYFNAYSLTPEELSTLESIIQDNVGDASGALLDSISEQSQELQTQIQQGENVWRDFIPNLVAGMKSKQTFKDLDSDLQDIVVQIVEGLDYSYATAMKEWNPNDPYAYIRDNIIVPMGKLSDEDKNTVKDSFTKLMTLDPEDISNSNRQAIDNLITKIADILEKDAIEIKVALGFDIGDDARKRLQNSIRGIADDHGLANREQIAKLNEYTDKLTLSEVELWLKATQGAKNATEAIEMYENALSGTQDALEIKISLGIAQTIEQLNTQLKPAMDSLKSAWNDIFTDDGFAINSIDILSTCDSIKSKLDDLNEIEGITVDYSAFEDFVRVLNNTESTEQNVEDAFDSLASSITQAALSGTEDFETMKAALEDLGVVNNELVAFDALITNTEALKEVGLDLVAVSQMEADEADVIIEKFVNESVSAENVSQAIAMLTYQKELCNLQEMNTAEEVANLKTLAENAGYTGEVIQYLTELEEIYQTVASGVLGTNNQQVAMAKERARQLTQLIAESGSKVEYKPKVDFSGATKAAKSAGKEAGKSYKDGLKEELSDLEGIISSLSKAIDDQKEVITSQKEVALEAIESQISALEAERDARLEAIEAEKKALENQIKAIDKQIDAKQKEIDAINDAAKARQHEIDLQKAQYELERMQNQRTMLVYSEDKGLHYRADESGIRDAKESVDDAKRQLEIDAIEREIDLLEESKDLLNEQIDLLDEQADNINKYYDAQIKSLEKQKESTEKYFESLIKSIEGSKDKYQELLDIVDKAELSGKLKKLGIDEEALLNGSEEEFEKLKNAYLDVVFQVNEGNEEMLSSLRELSGYDGTAPTVLSDTTEKLNEMNEQLDTSTESMDNLSDSATTASEGTSAIATSMEELSTSTEGLSENLTSINDALTDIPEADKLDHLTTSFANLGEAIQAVADVLGIGEEGAVSTLVNALQEISTLSLDGSGGEGGSGSGIVSQFQALKTAVEDVTSAISGGGSSSGKGGDASNSSSPSMSSGTSGGNGASGLVGAIESFKSATDEALGSGGEEGEGSDGEGSGAIGQFGQLKKAVDEVSTAIGSGDSENGDGGSGEEEADNLIGAINNLGTTTENILTGGGNNGDESGGVIGRFEEFKNVIGEANQHVTGISEGLTAIDGQDVECTIRVNIITTGGLPAGLATGTALDNMNFDSAEYNAKYTGSGHYEGTAKLTGDWGVKQGGSTLVGELGQELVVFPNGRFKTVGDNGAEFVDIPKGSIVFNHLQTRELLSKGNLIGRGKVLASGTALAQGNVSNISDGSWIGADGHRYRDLQPGDRAYELQKAFEPFVDKILKGEMDIISNAVFEGQKQMERWTKEITNNTAISNITNNRNVQPNINVGDIHVTCPGVTSQEVMREVGEALGKQIGHLSQRALQEQPRRY